MENEDPKFKPSFMPIRRSNIPCHYKLDTESLCQILIPYKERIEARKTFVDQSDFNDWVWDKAIFVDKLVKKFKGFLFHHEINTVWLHPYFFPDLPEALLPVNQRKDDYIKK